MSKIHLARWCVGVLLASFIAAAPAATISLNPLSQVVSLGNQVSLQIEMDFTDDPTLGGGIDIFFDSTLLGFVSFTFDPGLGDDPFLQRQPDVLMPDPFTGHLNGLAFGHFDGLSGPSLVGTLTFQTLDFGTAYFYMTDNVDPVGQFYSAVTFEPQDISYYDAATVNIITAVPLPSAFWLMLGGMSWAGIFMKKRRTTGDC